MGADGFPNPPAASAPRAKKEGATSVSAKKPERTTITVRQARLEKPKAPTILAKEKEIEKIADGEAREKAEVELAEAKTAYAHALRAYEEDKRSIEERRQKATQGGIFSQGYMIGGRVGRGFRASDTFANMKVGAGVTDKRYQEVINSALARDRASEATKADPDRPNRAFNSAWKNFFLAALAVFGAMNTVPAGSAVLNRSAVENEREQARRDKEERERMHAIRMAEQWAVQPGFDIVLSDEGSPFASLFETQGFITISNQYLGIEGRSLFADVTIYRGQSIRVSGSALLRRLWDMKCEAGGGARMRALADENIRAYEEAVRAGSLRRSSLALEMARAAGFERNGITYTEAIAGGIDWNAYGESQDLSVEQRTLVTQVAQEITPLMIEAIFLGELGRQMVLPSSEARDGEQMRIAGMNLRTQDFMLQTYGEDFVNRYPALGDTEVSMGGGQPTRYVVGENRSTGLVNQYLDPEVYSLLALSDGKGGIRDSIASDAADIRSHAEQQAITYMNAIYNVTWAIANNPRAALGFRRIIDAIHTGTPEEQALARERLVEFLLSHNNPAAATRAWGKWSERADISIPVARYTEISNHSEYATSLRFNYRALEAAFGHIFRSDMFDPGTPEEDGTGGVTIALPDDTGDQWTQIRRNMSQPGR